jgi:hypothetical protein
MASQTRLYPVLLTKQGHAQRRPARLAAQVRRAGELFLETLREIFDENAYQRFLGRRGMASSRAAYAEFLEEMRQCREHRVRCC